MRERNQARLAGLVRMPFVGRSDEMERLMRRLDAAAAGEGGLALVSGEPGIGKTRIAEAFVERAHERGARVLLGRCHEGEQIRPYGPFAEAIAACVRRDAKLEGVAGALGTRGPVLARLVPEVGGWLALDPEPAPLEPEQDRVRLLDAVAGFFVALSAAAPVVLVLEDLHWADAGVIAMLRQLLRRPDADRVLVLGTHRDAPLDVSPELRAALVELRSETREERIRLGPLERDDVARLVGAVLGEQAQPVLEATLAATDGNPLFIQEWLRHLLESANGEAQGAAARAGGEPGGMAVPERLRSLVLRRAERLADDARGLLRTAAVLGDVFDFTVLQGIGGLDEPRALAALEQGLAAHLVRPTGDGERYEFAHAMIRHALAEDSSPSRSVRAHRRVAEALERFYGERASEHGMEIAHHYRRSAALPGAARGVVHALAGAEQAARRGAHDEVVRALEVAVELLPADDERLPGVLARLALAQVWTKRFDEAIETAHAASDRMALAAGPAPVAAFYGEMAKTLAFAGAWREAGSLAARGLVYAGERRDGAWVWLRMFDILRRQADEFAGIGMLVETPECAEVRAVADAIELTVEESGLLGTGGFTSFASPDVESPYRAALGLWSGPFRECALRWEQIAAQAALTGRVVSAAYYWAHAARLRAAAGDFREARAAYDRALALNARTRGPSIHAMMLAQARSERALLRGEDEDAVASLVEELLAAPSEETRMYGFLAPVRSAGAVVEARLGRHERARRYLDELLPAVERGSPYVYLYPQVACDAAETAWLVDDPRDAAVIERNLRDKALWSTYHYPARHVLLALARVCALQKRFDEASDWFARARSALEELGARPLRAVVDHDEAWACLRRGAAGDAARAEALLAAADERFRTLDMPGWCARAARTRALLDRAGGGAGAGTPRSRATVAAGVDERALAHGAFHDERTHWRLSFDGVTVRVPNSLAVRYLAYLVEHPGREFHARELINVARRLWAPPASVAGEANLATARDLGGGGDVLDARARAEYRERLRELAEDLAEAEDNNDAGRTELLRAEMETLTEHLGAALALGGRVRQFASDAERARLAVTKRIKAGIKRIRECHPALGEHLARHVRTGTFCSYGASHAPEVQRNA